MKVKNGLIILFLSGAIILLSGCTKEGTTKDPVVSNPGNSDGDGQNTDSDQNETVEHYSLTITNLGKYLVTINEDETFSGKIVNSSEEVIRTIDSNLFIFQVSEIEEFFIVTNDITESTNGLSVGVEEVTDDYSDRYEDEDDYLMGVLKGQNQQTGSLNYSIDQDIFVFPNRTYLDLTFTSEHDITLNVMDGGQVVDQITNGETLQKYYVSSNNSPLYLLVSSNTQQLGSYTIDYEGDYYWDFTPEIVIGQTIESKFDYQGDIDYYTLSVPSDSKLWVNKNLGPYYMGRLYLDFINSDGVKPPKLIFDNGYNNLGYGLKAGDYKVAIWNETNSALDYSILFTLTTDDFGDDYAETLNPPKDVTVEEDITAKINFQGDIDLFNLNFEEEGFYLIEVTNAADLLVERCYQDYRTINYLTCTPINLINDSVYYLHNTDTYDQSPIPRKIDYILKVSVPYYKNYIGDYSVNITKQTDENDLPDDLTGDAYPILNTDESVVFIHNYLDTYDFYELVIEENGDYQFTMKSTLTQSYRIIIYDENKELLYETANYGYDSNYHSYLNAGIYYMGIIGPDMYGVYNFTVESIEE